MKSQFAPRPKKSRTGPGLQGLVNGWLSRLEEQLPRLDASNRLMQISPLKKDKHRSSKRPTATEASRIVLRLLAERVAGLCLDNSSPELLEALAGPTLTEFEATASHTVATEIAELDGEVLNGWALAGLQVWSGETRQQKQSGAFYTSPELARYIVAKALPSELSGPIVDPACGGGAFLLAALESLSKQGDMSPNASVIGQLYGVDLNPQAVVLTRLALLRRLSELAGGKVSRSLAVALVVQVRPGNALVGAVQSSNTALAIRKRLFEALAEDDSGAALALFAKLEAELSGPRLALTEQIAGLPIFNGPDDGSRLAALQPFGWQLEFPEVFEQGGFGVVVGNPPYLGFNDYSGIEKAYFAQTFAPVYNLKSDLHYYFVKRGIELLRPGGRLGFVTSRFWKEAAFAAPLRRWLANQTRLLGVEDLGGEQFFEGAEVDVCLLFASREQAEPEQRFPFYFAGREEWLSQTTLADGAPWAWLRRMPAERMLLAKIAEQSHPLGQLAECRTGVQTGLDRVFFLTTAQAGQIEAGLVRRAIKNGDVGPGRINWRDLWLLYPPADLDPALHPRLLAYLEPHRAALEHRLRYDEPFPYYQLQWPRDPALFEAPTKLVTPYKAPRNIFALDDQQFFFSTDVISVCFPPEWSLEQLRLALNFLNSRLSTFQFRSYGKQVGGGQWDYYANPVKRLAFPAQSDDPLLKSLARPDLSSDEIDELVFDLYQLSGPERDLIVRSLAEF